tara:strand:+ start:161 stop:424 length:264 start_codon:yes stop_codon:yes gene_type:complete
MNKSNTTGEVFNVGRGKPMKIRSIINLIRNKVNRGTPKFGEIKLRPEENLKTYPNISKLIKFTQYRAKINFSDGLTKTINFYKKNKL